MAIQSKTNRWFSTCLKITRDRELAEDAVQDALLNAWKKRHQYEHTARLDQWINRIAVNSALQLLRKNKPGRWETLEHEILDDSTSPLDAWLEQEMSSNLNTALLCLSEMERICFVLKHIEQWRLSEIAEELDTNVGRIKQALFRAVKKLRITMSDLRSAS